MLKARKRRSEQERMITVILAEKIMNLRKRSGWSQEELAEKMQVSRQSVSKWESAASIPDLDKILKLSDLFCVSTDYLLKEELEEITFPEDEGTSERGVRTVSIEEANRFLENSRYVSGRIAMGVSLLILSPVCLIQFAGLAEAGKLFSENMAGGLGVAVLLGVVALGVGILIFNANQMKQYEFLEKESFFPEYGVAGVVMQKKREYEKTNGRMLMLGVILCICGVIPLMLGAGFNLGSLGMLTCVNVLLLFISAGVHLMVRAGVIYGSFEKLLQTGEYTEENKALEKRISFFPGTYWCLMTAIYLGLSFLTGRWDVTWILWPVAGVLFAAIHAVLKAVLCRK